MSISLLTHGWVCYRKTIINKYILPLNVNIRDINALDLNINEIQNLNLNIENLLDKNINLKLDSDNINIKKII